MALAGDVMALKLCLERARAAAQAPQERRLPRLPANADAMLRVIRNHKRAADGEVFGYEELSVAPTSLDHASVIKAGPAFAHLGEAARNAWSSGHPRQRHQHGLPRTDDEPQPGAHDRPPDRRDAPAAPRARPKAGGRSGGRDAGASSELPSRTCV